MSQWTNKKSDTPEEGKKDTDLTSQARRRVHPTSYLSVKWSFISLKRSRNAIRGKSKQTKKTCHGTNLNVSCQHPLLLMLVCLKWDVCVFKCPGIQYSVIKTKTWSTHINPHTHTFYLSALLQNLFCGRVSQVVNFPCGSKRPLVTTF